MENIEFYMWGGKVRYRINGQEHVLDQKDRDIIDFVLDSLQRYFPEALDALSDEYADSKANRRYYDFRRVDRFVRCNFAEADALQMDIGGGIMHFEEVKCPMRGICRHEHKICKPRFKVPVPEEEGKVAALYSRGLTADEIAGVLRKSIKTVKNQLTSATKRLKLSKTRDLIKIFSIYNITTL